MDLPTLTHLHFSGNFFSGNLSSTNTSPSSCNFQILDLSRNNFSQSFDLMFNSLLLSCHQLFSLDLSYNRILSDSNTPSLVTKCGDKLNYLNLSNNKLTGNILPTSLICSCNNLTTLDLSHNLFSTQIPTTFPIQNLHFLDLSHNNFTGYFSSFEFGSCTSLIQLNLSRNALSGTAFPITLSNCKNLESLDVSRNALLLNIPGSMLGNLKKLRYLSLSHNHFYGEIPPDLGNICATLEELDLSANQLTGGLPKTFLSCSSLLSLNLGNNMLSGDFITTVISLLISIYLSTI